MGIPNLIPYLHKNGALERVHLSLYHGYRRNNLDGLRCANWELKNRKAYIDGTSLLRRYYESKQDEMEACRRLYDDYVFLRRLTGIEPVVVLDSLARHPRKDLHCVRRPFEEKAAFGKPALKPNLVSRSRSKESAQILVEKFGIPTVVAQDRQEAEAVCCALAEREDEIRSRESISFSSGSRGQALNTPSRFSGFVVTMDSDCIPFGAPMALMGLSIEGKSSGLLYKRQVAESKLNLPLKQIRQACVASGCDFGQKVKGIGPVKAFGLIRQYGSIDKIPGYPDGEAYNSAAILEIFERTQLKLSECQFFMDEHRQKITSLIQDPLSVAEKLLNSTFWPQYAINRV